MPIVYSSSSGINGGSAGGMGMTFRDSESSTRALAQLQRQKLVVAERKRASGLLLLLCAVALFVHSEPMLVSIWNREDEEMTAKGSSSSTDNSDLENAANVSLLIGNGVGGNSSMAGGDDEDAESRSSTSIWSHLMDTIDRPLANSTSLFFHVPRNGGQSIKDIVGSCLGLVQASDVGIRNGHDQDASLQIVDIEHIKYVNVDVNSKPGIERAASLGCCSSRSSANTPNNATSSSSIHPDLVSTPYFLNAVKYLFSAESPARAFILLRNPMERALSMYEYQKEMDPNFDISLEDYAHGNGIENNWMVRYLTNVMEGELKQDHVTQAKKIISKKFLIGFLEDLEETIIRLMKYNAWSFDEEKEEEQKECISNKLKDHVEREHEMPKKGTQTHTYLSWQTQYDFKLYEFAKQLYEIQTKQYGSKERKKELKKKEKEKNKNKS